MPFLNVFIYFGGGFYQFNLILKEVSKKRVKQLYDFLYFVYKSSYYVCLMTSKQEPKTRMITTLLL